MYSQMSLPPGRYLEGFVNIVQRGTLKIEQTEFIKRLYLKMLNTVFLYKIVLVKIMILLIIEVVISPHQF